MKPCKVKHLHLLYMMDDYSVYSLSKLIYATKNTIISVKNIERMINIKNITEDFLLFIVTAKKFSIIDYICHLK